MKLSVLIPVYNEISTIEKLINKVKSQKIKNLQIIVVDDCSTDGTKQLLKKKLYKEVDLVIYHKNNKGKGAAIKSAQKFISGDLVIIQDGDLEYNPRDYEILVKPIISGLTKVVYGSRVKKNKRYETENFISLTRIFFNHILTIFSNFLNNQSLTDAHTCYKTFDAKLFKSISLKESDFAFCPEITTKISKLNVMIVERRISYKGRSVKEGKKIGVYDGFRAIYVLLKYKFFC